jgi:ribosomal protein S27E
MTTYRCNGCGNKTRFDIFETKKVRAFHHYTLGGEDTVEEEEIFSREIEKIVCRWCGSTDVTEDINDAATAREH